MSSNEALAALAAEVDAILDEAVQELESKVGQVVIYNDDHNSAKAVSAAIAEVMSDKMAGIDETDDELSRIHKRVRKALYRMMKAEEDGSVVVYEGPMVECLRVLGMLTKGGADAEWFLHLAEYAPVELQLIFAVGSANGEFTASMEDLEEDLVPRVLIEYLEQKMPRPVLTAEIIEIGEKNE